jgi:DNA-directed RNA polymerase specialized sigma24 family protein
MSDGLHATDQRHQAQIYNIAVRMLHHPQDAEDATQEILIKVDTGDRPKFRRFFQLRALGQTH